VENGTLFYLTLIPSRTQKSTLQLIVMSAHCNRKGFKLWKYLVTDFLEVIPSLC